MYVYIKATKKIKMEIHVWVNRIIIKNMLANPEAYVKGYPFTDNEGYKNSKQLFLETEPSFSRWLDIQRFSLLLQVGNSHNNPIILHLNYCNGLFSAPAQLHSFRYFPKEHFLLYCFVQDTTFPPPPITAIKATPIFAPTSLSTGWIHRLVSLQSFSL